jgi:hypothetical protein
MNIQFQANIHGILVQAFGLMICGRGPRTNETMVRTLRRSFFFSRPVSLRKHRTASKNDSLGREKSVRVSSHICMTRRSARHSIGEARNNENGSEKREFDDKDD